VRQIRYVNDEEIDSMTSFLRMKRLKSIFSDLPKSIFTTSPPSAARKWEDLRNEIMKLRIPVFWTLFLRIRCNT
jgi:hypothetical protein